MSEQDRLKDLTLLSKNESNYFNSPDDAKLECFENQYSNRDYWITFDCPEFTSLCPVTGQPDFGHIIIKYIPDKKCVESKSLKMYLFAFRNHNTFHEEVVNKVLSDLVEICDPREAVVIGDFRPRGGISLKIEASHSKK
ncbi:MAG: preQ(1) synthase [Lentisphaeraceae bacterium]|nr:preQ(1) synthase [Lentisphaeraceae bacterium]